MQYFFLYLLFHAEYYLQNLIKVVFLGKIFYKNVMNVKIHCPIHGTPIRPKTAKHSNRTALITELWETKSEPNALKHVTLTAEKRQEFYLYKDLLFLFHIKQTCKNF